MTATQDRAAIAAHFAAGTTPTALGPVLASMSEYVTGPNPQRGRGAQFAPRKAARAFRAVLPSWALAAFTVCLAIPGPADEAVAFVAALVLLVVRFPRARSAWKGGKSHRKAAVR